MKTNAGSSTRAITLEGLRALLADHEKPCLSIYVPMSRAGAAEDRAHFEGLLRAAHERLAPVMRKGEIDAFLAPLGDLSALNSSNHALDGLAVFHSKDLSVHYRLPGSANELVIAADSFHVRPLLHFLQSNRQYYLLVLSQGHVALFKGSRSGLASIAVPELPNSVDVALGEEEKRGERSLSAHSGGGHGSNPIFTGHDTSSAKHEDLARFFRGVDKALWRLLRDESAPLILAANEKQFPMFRAISRYGHIAEEGLHGNFADAKIQDLHERAWPIVERRVAAREAELLEHYGTFAAHDRALDDISNIARYAIQGRVRELLLAEDTRLWGKLDKASGALTMDSKHEQAQEDDVLDDIAEAVLVRGGEVFAFAKARMPSKSPVAAILRW